MSRRLALLIEQGGPGAPAADGAEASASAALAALLQDPEIGGFERATVLRDLSHHDALQAIETLFARRESTDLLFLLWRGRLLHSGQRLYLALKDSRAERPRSTAIDGDFIQGCMDDCASRCQVLLIDGHDLQTGSQPPPAPPVIGGMAGPAEGRFVLQASRLLTPEAAAAALEERRSPTRLCLDALRSGGAAPRHDALSVQQLFAFIRRRLQGDPAMRLTGIEDEAAAPLLLARNPQFRDLPPDLRSRLSATHEHERLEALVDLLELARDDPALIDSAIATLEELAEPPAYAREAWPAAPPPHVAPPEPPPPQARPESALIDKVARIAEGAARQVTGDRLAGPRAAGAAPPIRPIVGPGAGADQLPSRRAMGTVVAIYGVLAIAVTLGVVLLLYNLFAGPEDSSARRVEEPGASIASSERGADSGAPPAAADRGADPDADPAAASDTGLAADPDDPGADPDADLAANAGDPGADDEAELAGNQRGDLPGGQGAATASPPPQLSETQRRDIQSALIALGFDGGWPDGVFSSRTRAAIRDYQTAGGQEPTGELDADQAAELLATAAEIRAAQFDPPPDQPSAQELYDTAFRQLQAGDYAGAVDGFKRFVSFHPDHALAPQAAFWAAEAHYVMEEYATAAVAFAQNFRRYGPEQPRAADNLLKLGMALNALGRPDKACTPFDRLAAEFPRAPVNIQQQLRRQRERAGCV